MPKKVEFDTSPELKVSFNLHFEQWRRKNGAGIDELARRCGVSPSYLAHVGRYGRVPGKPILILLALNFEIPEPQSLFDAARLDETFPYDRGLGIRRSEEDQNFLSVKLDMNGLAQAIRGLVEKGTRSRSIEDLTQGRPLRIGLNQYQQIFFRPGHEPGRQGFFLEVCDMLAMSMRCRFEAFEVPYAEYPERLKNHEIDIFGPKNIKPAANLAYTSIPFCRMGMSALVRKRRAPNLEDLPAPETVSDLHRHPYQIAVLRNGRSHLYANVALGKKDSELVICDTLEEAIERATLVGIPRPVHLVLSNSPALILEKQRAPELVDVAFATPETVLEFSDDCFAVRSDWSELVSFLNHSIQYLIQSGALAERFNRWLPPEMKGLITLPLP